jgi:hypothetical protein
LQFAPGAVLRRVRWETRDTLVTPDEFGNWLDMHSVAILGARTDSARAARRLDELRGVPAPTFGAVVRALRGGTDSSIWVLPRSKSDTSIKTVEWLGFDHSGSLLGVLEVPVGVVVHEISATHALVQRGWRTPQILRVGIERRGVSH